MLQKYFIPFLLISPVVAKSQDTIYTKNNKALIVKIVDSSESDFFYIPILSISKRSIAKIHFNDGGKFVNDIQDTRTPKEILQKGNLVFIECENQGARDHTIEALQNWGHWQIVEDINLADLILKIDFTAQGKAEVRSKLTNAISGDTILDLPRNWVLFGDHMNPKKAAVYKHIAEKLILLSRKLFNS
jgi:hypothetical protein